MYFQVVIDRDQDLRELSVNMISRFTICVKREIREWQVSPFVVIFSENLANFNVISREIAEITWIGSEQEFTI